MHPGTYDLEVAFLGSVVQQTSGVIINTNDLTTLDIYMSESEMNFHSIQVVQYNMPEVWECHTTQGSIVNKDSFRSNIQGKVLEASNGMPVPFAIVALIKDGKVITGGDTNFDGAFYFGSLEPGLYDLEVSFIGFATNKVKDVIVSHEDLTTINIKMIEEGDLIHCGGCFIIYDPPLIDFWDTTSGTVIKSDDSRAKQF